MSLNRQRIVNVFVRLVRMDLPSLDERKIIDYITQVFKELDLEV